MRNYIRSILVIVLLLTVGLTGCGGESTKKSSSGGNGNNDVFIFGRGGDSISLDPISESDGESFRVTGQIYENLVTYAKDDMTIVPGLAESWEVSDDGMTYTFELKQGVTFHDGADFNAQAVVDNFERWLNGTEEQYPYFGSFGGFKGSPDLVIDAVKAEGEHTVVFALNRPSSPFLRNLAQSAIAIASPKAIKEDADKLKEAPVGTGPYQFVEWKKGDRITIERYEDYHGEAAKIKQVIFRVIPDNTTRFNALQNGEIDLMDGLNPTDREHVEANGDLSLYVRPSMNVGYIGFNVEKAPFDDVKVRQALNMATNKAEIIDSFFAGGAEPAKNPMPPAVEGYNDAIEDYPYDLDAAKKLLAEAGHADGFEIDLWYMPVARPYMPEGMKVAEILQAEWQKIGVTVHLKTVDWATYAATLRTGEWGAFMIGWTSDNGDPDSFLNVLLGGGNINGTNFARYNNPAVNKLLQAGQSEMDSQKRRELYEEAQVFIKEDAPWIPLVHSNPLIAGVKGLKGYTPHPSEGDLFSRLYFE